MFEYLWEMSLEERVAYIPRLTEEERRFLAKGYAVTAEAIADWVGGYVVTNESY